jgi:hypothetical protein
VGAGEQLVERIGGSEKRTGRGVGEDADSYMRRCGIGGDNFWRVLLAIMWT